MYKYFHFALIFGVSLFVATAHAATGLTSIDYDYGTLTPTQSSITFSDATSSDYDFWLPVGGTKQYYKYTYTIPSGYTQGSRSSGSAGNVQNKYYQNYSTYDSGGGTKQNGSSSGFSYMIADFINNSTTKKETVGGGFGTTSSYDVIRGAYIGNQVTSTGEGGGLGLGIFTSASQTPLRFGLIEGDFINNWAGNAGGAITAAYHYSTGSPMIISSIVGNFIGNSGGTVGGGLRLGYPVSAAGTKTVTAEYITGTFLQNTAAHAAAIYVGNYVGNIEANFIGNTATAGNGGAVGIDDDGSVNSINNSVFYGNSASVTGGAIQVNNSGAKIGEISNTLFINNTSASNGGAIYNAGTIGNITDSVFYGNSTTTATDNVGGGAIYNSDTINNITADFLYNSSPWDAGAVFNSGTIGRIVGNFEHNSAKYAGAFYNSGGGTVTITGNFLYNSASSHSGAIFNYGTVSNKTSTLSLLADTQDMTFYGNTDPTEYNDINNTRYSSTPVINMNAASGRKISFGGTVRGSEGALNLNNDSSAANRGGTYIFNNTVSGNRFNLYNFGLFC